MTAPNPPRRAETFEIGRARPDELALLGDIELEAASLFPEGTFPQSVLDEHVPLDALAEAQAARRLWVARTEGGQVVGFAYVGLVEGEPHLYELDVLPAYGRCGIGRRLVETVTRWATDAGYTSLTLTTDRHVPWNAPFYLSCGFHHVPAREVPPQLKAILDHEAARGLDPTRRTLMRLTLR